MADKKTIGQLAGYISWIIKISQQWLFNFLMKTTIDSHYKESQI